MYLLNGQCKIAIEADKDVKIFREEIYYQIKLANLIGKDTDINAPTELKLNGKLDLDLTKIEVSDAGETKTAEDLTTSYTNNGLKMFTVKVFW